MMIITQDCGDFAERFMKMLDLLGPFEPEPHIAVAVSGGIDSMTLAHLTHLWVKNRAGRMTALVVNHGLRDEAQDEAEMTMAFLHRGGIEAKILTNHVDRPLGGLQAFARERRYQLLENWCLQHGVLHLFVGHHKDDLHETVLLRTRHHSGHRGCAGLSAERYLRHCRLLRPMLEFTRQEIKYFAEMQQIPYLHDPSNQDRKFERVRLRDELKDNADQTRKLHATHLRSAMCRQREDVEDTLWMARHVMLSGIGYLECSRKELISGAHSDNVRRLQRLIGVIGGAVYLPNNKAVRKVVSGIAKGTPRFTLGRCLIETIDQHTLRFCRESAGSLEQPQKWCIGSGSWDGRYEINAENGRQSVVLQSAGDECATKWRQSCLKCSKLPHQALKMYPVEEDADAYCPHALKDRKLAGKASFFAYFLPRRSLIDGTFVSLSPLCGRMDLSQSSKD